MPWRRRILLLGMAIGAALGTLEVGARLMGPRLWHTDLGTVWAWIQYDPFLRWENKRSFEYLEYELNEHGLRGPSIRVAKPPEGIRILCLGDSSTFGIARGSAQMGPKGAVFANYPEIMSKLLARRERTDVEVLNAGVIGYTSSHGLRALVHRWLAFDPDIVVARFGMNGHSRAMDPSRRVREPDSMLGRRMLYLGARTGVGLLGFHVVKSFRQRPGMDDGPMNDLARFERDLRRFEQISRDEGFTLVLLDYPLRDPARGASKGLSDVDRRIMGTDSGAELNALHDRWQARQAEVAQELGVILVETGPECIEAAGRCFSDFDRVHPSEFGHRLIAHRLVNRLIREGLLERSSAPP